jgi:hypothetical protein
MIFPLPELIELEIAMPKPPVLFPVKMISPPPEVIVPTRSMPLERPTGLLLGPV